MKMFGTIFAAIVLAFALTNVPAYSGRASQPATAPQEMISVSLNGASIPRYQVAELSIAHSDAGFSNVWEGPSITATFTSPANRTFRVGGFYYSKDLWKARFAPSETGTWRYALEWRDAQGVQNASGTFECLASSGKGFVRRHPTNPFRLVFDDGSLYPAIGIGDCMLDTDRSGSPIDSWGFDGGFRPPGTEPGSSTDIDTYMSAYGNAGFNLFRWSVDNCAFKLWNRIEPGGNVYLESEGKFGDTLVVKLRQNGFRTYMAIFGFQPSFPNDTSDPARMNAVKRYAKYVVDRYGAYVDFWELMNEYPNPPAAINDQWYAIVADYIRSIDPYRHLISTNWQRPDLAAIEINSPHWYQDESEFDSDRVTDELFRHWKDSGKQVIVGEQGGNEKNWDERSALRMRLRSWTAFFVEGTLIFWNVSGFKDNRARPASIYLGPEERGYIRGLQNFTAGAEADVGRFTLTPSSSAIRAYGLRSARMILGYFHHFTSHQETVSSTLTLDVPAAGTAVWIDPASGNALQTLAVTAGRQTLTMPPFAVDLALKLQWGSVIGAAANVSAASFSSTALASESIVAAFGSNLATVTQVATTSPLPTMLAGTQVMVRDSAGIERPAPLFFVSPTQINYQMPPGVATGTATVTIISGSGAVSSGTVQIATVAPGLFAANASGQGVAAAVALRVKADGSQSFEPVAVFDAAQNRFVARPLDLGPPSDQVFLILFGTGVRFRSSLSAVMAGMGGVDAPVTFAGPQGNFVGLDQVNLLLPRSLVGRGEVDITLTVDGQAANTARISIR